MAGNLKAPKVSLEKMSKSEAHKYYTEQLVVAKKKLEQEMKYGNEKSVKRVEEIIRNLEGTISRLG